jgi:hypothetical protein
MDREELYVRNSIKYKEMEASLRTILSLYLPADLHSLIIDASFWTLSDPSDVANFPSNLSVLRNYFACFSDF